MTSPFETSLSGKHIVIVGGGSGMGKATATLAARLGARVTIASRNAEKLTKVAADIDGDVKVAPVDTPSVGSQRRCLRCELPSGGALLAPDAVQPGALAPLLVYSPEVVSQGEKTLPSATACEAHWGHRRRARH